MTVYRIIRILLQTLLYAGLLVYGFASLVPAYLTFSWCDGRYRDEATHSVICAPPGLDFYWQQANDHPFAAASLGLAALIGMTAAWRRFKGGGLDLVWLFE